MNNIISGITITAAQRMRLVNSKTNQYKNIQTEEQKEKGEKPQNREENTRRKHSN